MKLSLQSWTSLWISTALLTGVVSATIWASSVQAWNAHLDDAAKAGRGLALTMLHGAPSPGFVALSAVETDPTAGSFTPTHLDAGLAASARITTLTLHQNAFDALAPSDSKRLLLYVLSDRLQFPVAAIEGVNGAAEGLASLSRQMARHCAESVMFLQDPGGQWWRAESMLWSCHNQPRDFRFWAIALALAALLALWGHARDVTLGFRDLAKAFSTRTRPGQMEDLHVKGPIELRQTVEAVNAYLAEERERLARRVMVLSGVSHDLGTPATRLSLRVAMIEDPDLRARFRADLDKMATMIEEVLTFTRAEIGAEPEHVFSFRALVESVVADYQDTGRAVSLVLPDAPSIAPTGSVFGTAGGAKRTLREERHMLFHGRPMALERALSNLIDNALKYGRSAEVRLIANSGSIVVEVQDAGASLDPDTLERLTEPFHRGDNHTGADGHPVAGYGMGLSIVATIAAQHGGQIEFEKTLIGLCARLTLPREITDQAPRRNDR